MKIQDKILFIIASGPSLTQEDVSRVEVSGHDIMGINRAYELCKVKYLYSCDTDFWNRHYEKVDPFVDKYSLEETKFDDVCQMENDGTYGMSFEWPKIKTGQNSGYQAINLAYLLGYKTIILLGYDMQMTNGKSHWHEDHKGNNPNKYRLEQWRKNYNGIAPLLEHKGVKVLNATRETALDCFGRVSLDDIL